MGISESPKTVAPNCTAGHRLHRSKARQLHRTWPAGALRPRRFGIEAPLTRSVAGLLPDDRIRSINWGVSRMYAAVVEPSKIAQVLGLRRRVTSIEQLEQQVEAGLPKASLGAVARHVYGSSPNAVALMHRVIPAATFHRRGEELKPQEGERVERLARVIATAEYVWDSADDARTFLSTGHAMLGGKRPIEVALTELGARRVENLLWSLFHGVAA